MRILRPVSALAALVLAPLLHAQEITRQWILPMPPAETALQRWRLVELREGNGIRHEEYVPRDQVAGDYRDRILLQRFAANGMTPEAYLGHIASGLGTHCQGFAPGGLTPSQRNGVTSATRTAFCGRFGNRDYGYVLAQKAILDGDFLFVVEREWRIPAFGVDEQGLPSVASSSNGPVLKELKLAQRWLLESVDPAAPALAADTDGNGALAATPQPSRRRP
jgi:hypothetical protein